jgi:uncharacterized protein (TIGR00297 family)
VNMDVLTGNMIPAILVNVAFGLLAYRVGGVRKSGLLGGLLVGIPIYLFLGWRGFTVLAVMFVLGTALTRMGYARKQRMGVAEEKKGARGASHALANAGVAALCAFLAWLTSNPVWGLAYVAALATSSMDTAGSEIGPLWGRRTISLRNLKPVPPGTEGAVSLEGTLGGMAAALVLGITGAGLGLYSISGVSLVVLAATLGNLYEGIVGSRGLMPHTWLNATNTLVGALAAAGIVTALRIAI